MKNTIFILTSLFILSCSVQKLSKSGNNETQFVKNFIQNMIDETSGDSQTMRGYISPKYLKENKLDINNYSVNTYFPDAFQIETYDQKSGFVTAKIWGSNKGWIHRLKFKVENIDGKLYLYAGKFSDSYIDPWTSVESYIEE